MSRCSGDRKRAGRSHSTLSTGFDLLSRETLEGSEQTDMSTLTSEHAHVSCCVENRMNELGWG